jgi:hypothetical protein
VSCRGRRIAGRRQPNLRVDWLASRVFLSRTRLELKPHEALVANHPRIVTGFDHIRISRPQLGLRAILVQDGQTPRVNNAHVS